MLFELINALAMFQKLINHVLYDHLNEFIIAYLDDILIFFKTEKKHEKYIKKIFKNFQKFFFISNQKNVNFINNKLNI